FLKANIIMSALYIQITGKITVPIKAIFNNDFNNSTGALIENIFLARWIGSIFFKSNVIDSVENKKPICIRLAAMPAIAPVAITGATIWAVSIVVSTNS